MKTKSSLQRFFRNRKISIAVAMAAGQIALASNVLAATYYVATNGNNSSAGSSTVPFQTIQKGLSVLAPGDTLVIRDGTYSGSSNSFTNFPNGSSGQYITIMAENEGNVIITAGLSMADNNKYLIIQGLRFQDPNQKSIRGQYVKFFRNEFKGGCSSGNCMTTSVGTNDVNTTADILLEDNWFHGAGGRYNLLIYNSSRVVVRRAVVRHDGGWGPADGNPEAGITVYNTQDSSLQNCIVLDSNLSTYEYWQGGYYYASNSSSGIPNKNNSWLGNISLNNLHVGFNLDGPGSGHVLTDNVAVDTTNGGLNLGTSSTMSATVNRFTVLRKNATYSGDFMGGIGAWGSGTKTLKNIIIANMPTVDLSGVSASYFDTYNNGSSSSGTGSVKYSPFTNGLSYVTRIEAGSALKTAGSDGGQLGAQIVNRIGAAGTLQGETGWNADTGTALWPFPYEGRIKKEMCTDAGVTRGFCSSTSLTEYILTYLGNPNPYTGDAITLSAPTNLRVMP